MGDVMLGRGVAEALAMMEPEDPWGDVLPLLEECDLRMLNLECAVTLNDTPWTRTYKVFHFRAEPTAMAVLLAANIDAVSLANNHTLDFDEKGLLDTLGYLDSADIARAGAGRDLEEARTPAVVEAGGVRVGLIAFTDNEPEFAATPSRPGTAFLPVSLDDWVLARVEKTIESARRAGAQIVVFSNHWGPNMVQRPPELFQRFAHAVIDLGADVYFGHSAHVFQGVELYRGKPILYDTGDFLDDYAVDPLLRNDWSFLFRVTVSRELRMGVELIPVFLTYARVRQATGTLQESILRRMEMLSAELGTALTRHQGRLLLSPPAEVQPSPLEP